MHRRIYNHALDIGRLERLLLLGSLQDFFEQLLHAIRPDALPPFDKRGRVTRQLMLKGLFSPKELPVRILDPLGNDRFIAFIVERLEVMQAYEQARRPQADGLLQPVRVC